MNSGMVASPGPSSVASNDTGDAFRFVLPARLEYRDAARAFLGHVCDQQSRRDLFGEDVAHQVASAFVEAFNNAVIHAYRGLPPGPIEIELELDPDRLVLRVIDQGSSFQPDSIPPPVLDPADISSLPEGGMGLFIMRSFMDDVEYRREHDRNVLTLTKRLSPRPAGAARSSDSSLRRDKP